MDYALSKQIDVILKQFDFTGSILVKQGNELLVRKNVGFENQSTQRLITDQTVFCLGRSTILFTIMGFLTLIDQKKAKLSDKLFQYLPEITCEYRQVTLKKLVQGLAVAPDYFNEVIQMNNVNSDLRQTMEADAFYAYRCKSYLSSISYKAIVDWLNTKTYEQHKDSVCLSMTDAYVLCELIERISGLSVAEYLSQNVFIPLNMKNTALKKGSINCYCRFDNGNKLYDLGMNNCTDGVSGAITTMDDMLLFLTAIKEQRLLSKASYSIYMPNNGQGLCFNSFGNQRMAGIQTPCLSNFFYIDKSNDTVMLVLSNASFKYLEKEQTKVYLVNQLRRVIEARGIFPTNPILESINTQNGVDAANVTVFESQKNFVDSARNAMVETYIDRQNMKAYALTDQDIVIGYGSLWLKKKSGDYYIDTVIIDSLFQSKGYGKILIKLLTKKAFDLGAKRLYICVYHLNSVARHVYEVCGFRAVSVNDQIIKLIYTPNN